MAASPRDLEVTPICVRELDVVRAWNVTPKMRRVVFGGEAIGEHERDGVVLPPVQSSGFDDDLKLVFPNPGTGRYDNGVPTNLGNGSVQWGPAGMENSRTYTVRDFDAQAGEMTIDFAIHDGGLASDWARAAGAGSKLIAVGPKTSYGLPSSDWILIGGDETALPAIGRCLEGLPSGFPVTVIAEVADPAERQDFDCAADMDITWLYRSEAQGRSRLAEVVMAAPWRDGQPYLWVAAETMVVKPLRRWARRDRELPKEFINIAGYWRLPEAAVSGELDEPAERADDQKIFEQVEEYAEFLPAFALRAAVSLGIFFEIDQGAHTPADIALACKTDPSATAKLLRLLESLAVLTRDQNDHIQLTESGTLLADPDAPWLEPYSMTSVETRMQLGFVHLVDVVKTGRPVGIDGLQYDEWMNDPEAARALHDEVVEWPEYLAPAFPEAVSLDGVRTVAAVGECGGVYTDALLRSAPDTISAGFVGLPSVVERMRGDIGRERRESIVHLDGDALSGPSSKVDLLIVAGVVETLTDDDAVHVISSYVRSADRVVLPIRLMNAMEPSGHDIEEDLVHLCVYGSGHRSEDELRSIIERAGADVVRTGVLGWGANLVEISAR